VKNLFGLDLEVVHSYSRYRFDRLAEMLYGPRWAHTSLSCGLTW
jgi:hypothetical protein